MLRITIAFALALAAVPLSAAAQDTPTTAPMAALGMAPARIDYRSDDAPFVVFDITPRTLKARRRAETQEAELTFVATDALRSVDVYTAPRSEHHASKQPGTRTRCGGKIAGYHRCTITTREALLHLKEGDGLIGLRIEVEGAAGERSTVEILLPVKGASVRPPPLPVSSPMVLTPLAVRSGHE